MGVRERQVTQRCTPKHLEEYILAYNTPRPALSSHSDDGEHEEQRRAAAAADSGQADAASHLGASGASRSSNSSDPLYTTSLKQLVESLSRSEKEERAEIAEVTHKLRQYEHQQRRRQELLEHITSFLREEEENEETHNIMGTTPTRVQRQSPLHTPTCVHSPNHSPSAKRQVHNVESHTERHTANVISTLEGEAELRDNIPIVRSERAESAFTPIHSVPPKQPGSPYSVISSGMMTPTAAQRHPIKLVRLQPQMMELYLCEDEFYYRDQPQVQQLLNTTALPYKPTPAALYQRPQTSPGYPPPQASPAYGLSHYLPVRPPVVPSQTLPSVPGMSNTSAAIQSQFPHNFGPQPRSIYGVPKPKIPDFTTDSEKEFANLKLALDNLLEPYPELTEKYKYHVLLEHLKLPEAQMIGQSCRHDPFPYTAAMQALQLQYGQPHQLAHSQLSSLHLM